VETALACTQSEALEWLDRHGFIERRAISPNERRARQRTRELADSVVPDIAFWRGAILDELNTAKLDAADAGDDETLQSSASLCNVLENGTPAVIAREFVAHLRRDPAEVARLIEAGKAQERAARWLTAAIVLKLSSDVKAEDLDDAT
jgi:hypothetical protein